MICPRCNIELVEKNCSGAIIETCDKCGGLWLDDGEIQKVKESETNTTNLQFEKINTDKPVKCIKCENMTDRINYLYSTGIMIDKCPVCSGIWLDGGELEAIIEILKKDSDFDVSKLKDLEKDYKSEQIDNIYKNSIVRFFGKLF